jgi:hypothetical protein
MLYGPPPPTASTGSSEQRRGRNKRKALASTSDTTPLGNVKSRKERDPNWNRLEMLALVRAKRAEFIDELQVDDPRELMNTDVTK